MNLPLTILAAESLTAFMRPALLVLMLILCVLVLCSIYFTFLLMRAHRVSADLKFMLGMIYAVTVLVLGCTIACFIRYASLHPIIMQPEDPSLSTTDSEVDTSASPDNIDDGFSPAFTTDTDPKNWNINWEIMQNGTVKDTFQRSELVNFNDASQYSTVAGITTFRGDNYRSGSTYGTTDIVSNTLSLKWSANGNDLSKQYRYGWNSQPLVVRWDSATKAIMNLLPEKKAKSDLVEVIYATLDGHVYFYDLDDGSYTRNPINIGMPFLSSGTLDPRGYPLLYLGAGFPTTMKTTRMFVVSLIDGSILYEQTGNDIDAYGRNFAFNSSPLISADSDVLIWPCSSGILYTLKLNTKYDPSNGTITVNPENTAKVRYNTNLEASSGCESSAVIVGQYLYLADMTGMLLCLDLNSMTLKWAQNIGDSVMSTPVFEWGKDNEGYLYLGTKVNLKPNTSTLCKIDAQTGEIVWQKTVDGVLGTSSSYGGVVASPTLGRRNTMLKDMVFFNIARTYSSNSGTLLALDKATGDIIWEITDDTPSWSSCSFIYTEGNAYFVHCDLAGNVSLRNAVSGEAYFSLALGESAPTTPIVFENTIIVGTHEGHIFAINIE